MRNITKITMAVLLTIVAALGFSACADTNQNNGNSGGGNHNENSNDVNHNGSGENNTTNNNGESNVNTTMTVKLFVRDINFAPLSEKVYYGEDELCVSSETGYLTVTVPQSDDIKLTEKLSLGAQTAGITYVENFNQEAIEICIIKTDRPVDEFYMLSGKTVYAADEVTEDGKYIWSGETGAEGVELRIGDNILPRGDDIRNFGVQMVHKDSVITAYKEGCNFVNMNWENYNNVCFADILETIDSTIEITANGARVQVKEYGGVTFRVDNRK